jgi:hypothetical protein
VATEVGYTPKYEPVPCPSGTGGLGITCGDLIVPQDRTRPKGLQIRLLVVRVAETPHPASDPVVELGGDVTGSPANSLLPTYTFTPDSNYVVTQ